MVLPRPPGANDVAGALEKVEREQRVDQRPVDGGGPVPVEVGHGLELLEARAGHAAFQTAARAILFFDVGDVLENLGGAPSFLGGEGHEVVERGAGGEKAESAKTVA